MDLSKIQSQLESAKYEVDQLKSGRKVSSSRARAALMKVKKESDTLRKEILSHSKSLPVKHKASKVIPSLSNAVVAEVKPVLAEAPTGISEPPPKDAPAAAVIPKTVKPTKAKATVTKTTK